MQFILKTQFGEIGVGDSNAWVFPCSWGALLARIYTVAVETVMAWCVAIFEWAGASEFLYGVAQNLSRLKDLHS